MKKITLEKLLKHENKKSNDIIKWAYFGYGFLNRTGENKLCEIPKPVLHSICFDIINNVYYVDGAL